MNEPVVTLDDRDPNGALELLGQLPQGAARRTLALRTRLRATRQARQTSQALDTARLLAIPRREAETRIADARTAPGRIVWAARLLTKTRPNISIVS